MPGMPPGYAPSMPPIFDGGSEADRQQLLGLYDDFRRANDALDGAALRKVWSADPHTVFFNTNGHAYYGIDDWLKIWDHYRTRLELVKPGGSGAIRIVIRGDMALITDDHVGRFWKWIGQEGEPDFLIGKPYIRATMVCVREDERWMVVHAHFSSGNIGPRPDQA